LKILTGLWSVRTIPTLADVAIVAIVAIVFPTSHALPTFSWFSVCTSPPGQRPAGVYCLSPAFGGFAPRSF
jgi:hypothetical protein